MFRPLLRGRAIAPARLPDCDCAARLAAVEARLALVEGTAAAKPPAKARPAAKVAPAQVPKPDPDPPRDPRGWPEGYEVEVRQF